MTLLLCIAVTLFAAGRILEWYVESNANIYFSSDWYRFQELLMDYRSSTSMAAGLLQISGLSVAYLALDHFVLIKMATVLYLGLIAFGIFGMTMWLVGGIFRLIFHPIDTSDDLRRWFNHLVRDVQDNYLGDQFDFILSKSLLCVIVTIWCGMLTKMIYLVLPMFGK